MQKILENGLILRSLSEGHDNDRDTLAEFYMRVFGEAEPGDEDVQTFDKWTHDLLNTNPVMALENFFVVVDPAHDEKIVSALMLIPQTWTYAGIEFEMGRVELVATEKDYRRRGLVRELMNAAHARSADLGHLVQGITGIPYFYRQFGYTMAVDTLGSRCIVQFSSFAPLKDDKQPDFTLRDATLDDIPALMAIDEFAESQYLMTVKRDETMWHFEITGRHETPYFLTGDIQMIINQDNVAVGYVMLPQKGAYGKHLPVWSYVVGAESSMLATYADVMRGLEKYVDEKHPDKGIHSLMFNAGIMETLDLMVERTMGAGFQKRSYDWYLRVADPATFMTTIAPVLEERLEGSGAHRFTGKLTIGFHQSKALIMHFENGKFISADYDKVDSSDAELPFYLFWNIVFGHHSYDDLRNVHSDVWSNRKGRVLIEALFEKKRSLLTAIA